MPSDTHFGSALQELVEKRPKHGLFARCFAEADGDEAKTKARYITLRAAELEEAERIACETALQELRRREAEHSKLIESFTFEKFTEEYRGEIELHFYGWPERQKMFKQWRKQKIESL